jgi:carbon-monoxide dehydrogenase iron sulfur subunit
MTRREIFVRYDRCVGCHACEVACAKSHTSDQVRIKELLRGEGPQRYIWVDRLGGVNVPTVCRQCEDAPCTAVCPTGAMRKRADGVVVCQVQECIGCWMCVQACPFGAIGRGEGKAVKCDRACLDEEGTPACVRACRVGALLFMTVEELEAEQRKAAVASLIT